jgi:hypothetical protein
MDDESTGIVRNTLVYASITHRTSFHVRITDDDLNRTSAIMIGTDMITISPGPDLYINTRDDGALVVQGRPQEIRFNYMKGWFRMDNLGRIIMTNNSNGQEWELA